MGIFASKATTPAPTLTKPTGTTTRPSWLPPPLPTTTTPGSGEKCCWDRVIQSCNVNSDCDQGGEGCITSGTTTKKYGVVKCNTCASKGLVLSPDKFSCVAPATGAQVGVPAQISPYAGVIALILLAVAAASFYYAYKHRR